jgi:hypothetical protein
MLVKEVVVYRVLNTSIQKVKSWPAPIKYLKKAVWGLYPLFSLQMALMTFDLITGELVEHATVPVSPTPEYAAEFLAEFSQAQTPPLGSKAELFMDDVWNLLHQKGYC